MRTFDPRRLDPLTSPDELLTVRQLAPLLRCHYATVKLMAREGRIPMVIQRGKLVIRRSDFERWLRANTQ